METLAAFVAVAKLLPRLLEKEDMAVYATDTEKFLLFDRYGRYRIDIKAGDPLTPGGTPDLVLKHGKPISRVVPPEIYGLPARSIALPVEGGVVGLTFSVETEEELQGAMGRLLDDVEAISGSSTDIATKASELTTFMASVKRVLDETRSQLDEIDRIREFVDDVAENFRYISLNALIEAHRVGEHGRGFAVVAKAMQGLSDETRKSIGRISGNLQSIHSYFSRLETLVGEANADLQAQSASSRAIAANLKDITASMRDIGELAHKLG